MQVVVRLDVTEDEAARLDLIAERAGLKRGAGGRRAVMAAAARSFLTGFSPIPDAVAAVEWAGLDDAGRDAVMRALRVEAGRVMRKREFEATNRLILEEKAAKAARRADVLRRQREQRGNAKHLRRLHSRAETMARHDVPTGPQNPIWALLGADAGNHSRDG